jgi:LysR family transcriptional regulator, glycine cleavage system transcriptional activator
MRPRLPPLNNLKAFEAAARHESFTRAAEELCVTQGAVSQQVKALEEGLGVKMFNRERQRLIITDAGRDYLMVVRDALDRIAVGTERLLQRQNAGVLTVSTSPDFAAKWFWYTGSVILPRRIPASTFASRRRCIMSISRARRSTLPSGMVTAIGFDTVQLSTEPLFAVCSPKLLSGRRKIGKPGDILRFPLIHLDSRADWTKWLRAAGVDDGDVTHGPVLNRASLVIDAAINGQGVALARTTLAAWDLINGRLVRPFPDSLPLSKTYWIICPKATSNLPKIVTFRDWLLTEASQDLQQLKKRGWLAK